MDVTERAFRLALRAYPREFQRRFGAEMIDFFNARRAQARSHGGRVALLLRMSADLLVSLVRERGARLRWPVRRKVRMTFSSDISGAARFLRRAPGLTVAVILLMGSGIAAATAVFSVVNRVLLTPPPFAEPERLVSLWESRPERGVGRYQVGAHEYPVWASRTRTLQSAAAYTFTGGSANLTGAGDPAALFGVRVTSSFFTTLGTAPVLGRAFTADEDDPGRGQVVIISQRLWRERFGGVSDVIGRKILLDDRAFEVVGVMPAAFAFPAGPPGVAVDMWRPIAEPFHLYRGRHYMQAIGRPRAGLTPMDVERDLNAIAAVLEEELPQFNRGHRVSVAPLVPELVEDASSTLVLLQAAVLGLLLIGCANAAALLLASGIARRREIALRLALGAGRLRVTRQLLAETLMLCAAACGAGLAGAWLLTRAVPVLVPAAALAIDEARMDGSVVAFAVGVSLVTALVIGAAPILQVSGVGLIEALKGRGSTAERLGPRRVLVCGQIALTLVLAAIAAVSVRTLASLHRVDPGFTVDGLSASRVALPQARYPDAIAHQQFFRELAARLGEQPGVQSVGLANAAPLDGNLSGIAVAVEGRAPAPPGEEINTRYRVVSSRYFSTLGIPIVAGRAFTDRDARRAVPLIRWHPRQPIADGFDLPQPPPVALINEAMARVLWPDGNALGSRFTALLSPPITVVGIAGDTRDESLASAPRPEFYLHDQQEPVVAMALIVRTAPDAPAAALIQSAVWAIDRSLPVGGIVPMADFVSTQVGLPRLTSLLMTSFAGLALALMAAGVYALVAFSTRLRSQEIGLRVALGASHGRLVRSIVRQGLTIASAGTAIGIGLMAVATPLAGQLPFAADSLDATTVASASATVLIVVALASWLPARRASKVDPLVVLRHE